MDKNSYALGMSIAHNMISSGVKEIAFDDFVAGLKAALQGEKTEISYEEAAAILDKLFKEIEDRQASELAEIGEAMKKEGEEFLAANARREGVHSLPSGIQYKVLKEGSGRRPGRNDRVKCHYEGRFVNGQIFDSSYKRGEAAVFGLNQVISGWTEGLQLMSEGSEWELYLPYNLAYGEAGAQGAIPPYAALIFKVELIQVL